MIFPCGDAHMDPHMAHSGLNWQLVGNSYLSALYHYTILFAYRLSISRNSLVMSNFIYDLYFQCYDLMMMLSNS